MHLSAFPVRALLFLLSFPFATGQAGAAVYAVGPGPGCTHSTIQAAINAAEANPGEDFIRIPHSQVWTNQALVINTGQTLSLEGFWSDCNTIDDTRSTVLDGAGGSAAPVLRIEGSGHAINLNSLTIRNGDVAGPSGKGGGIWYRGNGTLRIAGTSIINNTAGRGGGLYLEGTGSAATVHILGGVGITGNTAVDSGGGVFAEAVHLYMTQPGSIIAFNKATGYSVAGLTVGGYGGGLVVNCTTSLDGHATIGSAGVGNAGAIYSNTARFGGGVAVLGESGSDKDSYLYLHTTQPDAPAKIDQNFASVSGGGLYLYGYDWTIAQAHLWWASIEGNAAPEGAAISMNDRSWTYVNYVPNSSLPPEGALPCPLGAPCGRIADNVVQDTLGQPTGGAVLHVRGAVVHASTGPNPRGFAMERNRGGRLVDIDGGLFSARSLLIAGNDAGQHLIRKNGSGELHLFDSTIAGNTIGGNAVLDLHGSSELVGLLLWQPGKMSVTGGDVPSVQWTIASEAQSLGGGPGAIVADPRFVDPARGDYRLRAASPAVDYAPPVPGDDRDVFGLPRDQHIAAVPRPTGYVRDVGAHERATLQPLVLNGDFAADLNLWSGPATAWDPLNIVGPGGSGSAYVASDVPGNGSSAGGASQCIHLPGPGTYALNGWANSFPPDSPSGADAAELHWVYRRDGGEACTQGSISAEGVHVLNEGSGAWNRPEQPARIVVPDTEWNHNSSITVTLAVRDRGTTHPATAAGWFDGITLEWSADTGGDDNDSIFRSDFEEL